MSSFESIGRATQRRAMGLFDDLPSAKRLVEAAPPALDPEPKRAKTEPAPAPAPAPADHVTALERIATHIANPAKFKKAAALALALMRTGDLERRHGKALFKVLEAAMHPTPRRANDPSARYEYRELFDAAETCADDGVLNAKHKARLTVWMTHVRLVNDVHTDDNFQFAKATKAIAARVDALPPYVPLPDPDPDPKPGTAADDDFDDAERLAHEARMRRAERAAEAEAHTLLDDERDALLDAVDAAETHYRWNWAQTAIEMLVEATHTRRDRFSPEQAARVESRWEATREKRNARKGGGGGGGEKATSFDRAQAKVRGESMSVRGSVGNGTRDGRGESGVNTFG